MDVRRRAIYRPIPSASSKIPQPDIDLADGDGNERHRHAVGQILNEAEAHAVTLGDAGDGEIRRGAGQRAVAAEAGAERQAPPQRRDRARPAKGRCHAFDHRNHGGDERNVVEERR